MIPTAPMVKSWAEFITSVPPGAMRTIPDMYAQVWPPSLSIPGLSSVSQRAAEPSYKLVEEPIVLFCGTCDGGRTFDATYKDINLGTKAAQRDHTLTSFVVIVERQCELSLCVSGVTMERC